jgi:hypothetical protein
MSRWFSLMLCAPTAPQRAIRKLTQTATDVPFGLKSVLVTSLQNVRKQSRFSWRSWLPELGSSRDFLLLVLLLIPADFSPSQSLQKQGRCFQIKLIHWKQATYQRSPPSGLPLTNNAYNPSSSAMFRKCTKYAVIYIMPLVDQSRNDHRKLYGDGDRRRRRDHGNDCGYGHGNLKGNSRLERLQEWSKTTLE